MSMQYSSAMFGSANVSSALTAGGGSFASPWLDIASLAMPTDNKNALRWCEFIWDGMSSYRMAQERMVSYFLTSVQVDSADSNKSLGNDEKKKWEAFLHDHMGIMRLLKAMLMERSCYGNGFLSLVVPFRRWLTCPNCRKATYPLSEVYSHEKFRFEWRMPDFVANCPVCELGSGYRGPWIIDDYPEDLENKLKTKIWSVHEIEILHDIYTDDTRYLWRIPEDYKRQIREGNMFELERVPVKVLHAIHNNQLFQFADDTIFHMREPVVSGRRSRGWGLSRILINFRDIWYVQVLRRYNEAIALDYIIPFRLITPADGNSKTGDLGGPLRSTNLGNFGGQIMRMLQKRRRDPASWFYLPFPVNYQVLGGEASQLAPKDIMDQGMETMMNSSGTPMELYRGTLQLQTAPVSLRLFQATHSHLVHDLNSLLSWLCTGVSQLLSWENVRARMEPVTLADDFEKKMAIVQLAMAQMASQQTGHKVLGLDWPQEQRQIAEEAKIQSELQAEVQEEMEQAAFGEQIAKGQVGGGGAPAGGAPAGGVPAGGDPSMGGAPGPVSQMVSGGGVPQDLDSYMAQAEALADQLLTLPESQRLSEMRMLKKKNAPLHAMVKEKMEGRRNQLRTQGASMLLGQQGAAPQ